MAANPANRTNTLKIGDVLQAFFQLDASGAYGLFATEDDARVASSILPGFWLRPAWLWQADTLDPLTVFFEMRGIPPEQSESIRQLLRGGSSASEPEAR